MRIHYRGRKFSGSSELLISHAVSICQSYAAQGYDLTLRQLYYQFVARDLIPNKQSEYKRLGSVINDARLAGLLDWDYIVDRTRNVEVPAFWGSPADIIQAAANSYHLDRWSDQPYRVEVWVEKEALAGVVERACGVHRVPSFSCRGYVSQSELWAAGQRLGGYIKQGQVPVILHLGDHDPSGIDMTRDITDRLYLFLLTDFYQSQQDIIVESTRDVIDRMEEFVASVGEFNETIQPDQAITNWAPVIVNRIALNMDQILELNPPPNPTKFTDSRAKEYVERFGYESWELDALDPATLNALIVGTIEEYLDEGKYGARMERENRERDRLGDLAENWEQA